MKEVNGIGTLYMFTMTMTPVVTQLTTNLITLESGTTAVGPNAAVKCRSDSQVSPRAAAAEDSESRFESGGSRKQALGVRSAAISTGPWLNQQRLKQQISATSAEENAAPAAEEEYTVQGYQSLGQPDNQWRAVDGTDSAKSVIDRDLSQVKALLDTGLYTRLRYVGHGHGGLGSKTFIIGEKVKQYIVESLTRYHDQRIKGKSNQLKKLVENPQREVQFMSVSSNLVGGGCPKANPSTTPSLSQGTQSTTTRMLRGHPKHHLELAQTHPKHHFLEHLLKTERRLRRAVPIFVFSFSSFFFFFSFFFSSFLLLSLSFDGHEDSYRKIRLSKGQLQQLIFRTMCTASPRSGTLSNTINEMKWYVKLNCS